MIHSRTTGRSRGRVASALPVHKLRTDLIIRRRVYGTRVLHIVKDPIRIRYWSMDEVSFTIVSLCNGRRTMKEIAQEANRLLPNQDLNILNVRVLCETYARMGFFENAWERNVMLIERQRISRAEALRQATANPLEVTFRAWDPDRFLGRVVKYIAFLWSPAAVVVYALMALTAFGMVMARPGEFWTSTRGAWMLQGQALPGLVALWSIIMLSAVLHEFGHGLTCKHFGGSVHEMGFLLLYFNPCFYCDTTESYFFQKKLHKYATAFGGSLVNLVIASLAIIVWFVTPSDLMTHQIAHRVAVFNLLIGVLIQMNPLIKLDGYYLLSDYFEITNLQPRAFKFLATRVRRLLRLPHEQEDYTPRERRVFWIYGLLSISYLVVILSLVAALVGRFLIGSLRALGWILAGFLLYLMFGSYVKGVARFLRFAILDKAGHLRRHRWLFGGLGAALVVAFLVVPVPRHVRGDFVLLPGQELIVRALEPGIIEEVFVDEGDVVSIGDRLFALRHDEIELAIGRAATRQSKAEVSRRAALSNLDRATALAWQAEARGGAAQERYQEGRQSRSRLLARLDGVVLTPYLRENIGLAVEPGDLLCEIGDVHTLLAEILLDEQLIGLLDTGAVAELRLDARFGGGMAGRIERTAPVSTDGAVRNLYRILVRVDNDDGTLRPGMTGRARLDAGREPAFIHVIGWVSRMIHLDFWI